MGKNRQLVATKDLFYDQCSGGEKVFTEGRVYGVVGEEGRETTLVNDAGETHVLREWVEHFIPYTPSTKAIALSR